MYSKNSVEKSENPESDRVSVCSPFGLLYADFNMLHIRNKLLEKLENTFIPNFIFECVDDIFIYIYNLKIHIGFFLTDYGESMYLLTTGAEQYTNLRPSTRDKKNLGQQNTFIERIEHFSFCDV